MVLCYWEEKMDKKCKDGDYVEKQNTFAEGEKKFCLFFWVV